MSSSVAKSAGKMGLATLCSRVFGLVREQVFAFYFGATDAADAFNIAFRIPNLLRDLFAEGAMSAAFVPNFTRALLNTTKAAFRLLSSVVAVLVVGLSALSFVGICLSEPLVRLYASAFASVPGKLELATQLTQVMFPFFPMVALAAVLMGALNAMGSFFLPAFAPVLFNVASILCGVILTPLFANHTSLPPIYSMAVGVLVGGFLQFYVQWWQLRKKGYRPLEFAKNFARPFADPGTKKVLLLLVPGTVGLAATQLNILVNSVYATHFGSGAVSWLNYAFRFLQFPIGIFGVSLAVATLPLVTRKLAKGSPKEAADEVANSLHLVFAVNGPAAAGLMVVGLPIVQMIFQHGQFKLFDAQQTAQALFWYALGLPGYSVVKVLVPVFYALERTRIPVTISFVMVGLNLVLNHLFSAVWGFPFWALALSTSIVATLNAVLLLYFLNRKMGGILGTQFFSRLFAHGAVAAAVGATSYAASSGAATFWVKIGINTGVFTWSSQVVCALLAAIATWLAVGKVFRISEIDRALNVVVRRFRGKNGNSDHQ